MLGFDAHLKGCHPTSMPRSWDSIAKSHGIIRTILPIVLRARSASYLYSKTSLTISIPTRDISINIEKRSRKEPWRHSKVPTVGSESNRTHPSMISRNSFFSRGVSTCMVPGLEARSTEPQLICLFRSLRKQILRPSSRASEKLSSINNSGLDSGNQTPLVAFSVEHLPRDLETDCLNIMRGCQPHGLLNSEYMYRHVPQYKNKVSPKSPTPSTDPKPFCSPTFSGFVVLASRSVRVISMVLVLNASLFAVSTLFNPVVVALIFVSSEAPDGFYASSLGVTIWSSAA